MLSLIQVCFLEQVLVCREVLIFPVYIFSKEVIQHPRQQSGDRPVSGVPRLLVPTQRLPAVEAEGRPGPPSPPGIPHSDPGGRLSAGLHPDLRLAGSHRAPRPHRVRQ